MFNYIKSIYISCNINIQQISSVKFTILFLKEILINRFCCIQIYRRDQSFYSRTAENNKIKNILINVFLMLEEIDFFVINFIDIVFAEKLISFQQLKYRRLYKILRFFLINLLNRLYTVSLLFLLYSKSILISKSILKIEYNCFSIIFLIF